MIPRLKGERDRDGGGAGGRGGLDDLRGGEGRGQKQRAVGLTGAAVCGTAAANTRRIQTRSLTPRWRLKKKEKKRQNINK